MKKLRAYWYKRYDYTHLAANVGDMLTPLILEHLLGRRICWSSRGKRILACGSIVENIHYGDIIWGSGLIEPMKLNKKENVRILAVRGKYTRKYLMEAGYDVPELYGDPADLMPQIYTPKSKKKHKVGFVAHYAEKQEFEQWFGGHQINIINNPYQFIDEINECESIVTSSLHAFILASAYGLETEYVQLTPRIQGGMFKYHDYLSGRKLHDKERFIQTLIDHV